MDVGLQNREPGDRGIRAIRMCLFALIGCLETLSASVEGQVAVQAGGNQAVQPTKALQREIRQSALNHLRDGNLEQVLKVLEGPAESGVPMSLVEDDLLAPACAGLNRALCAARSRSPVRTVVQMVDTGSLAEKDSAFDGAHSDDGATGGVRARAGRTSSRQFISRFVD